jgi:hypothetical protein
MPVVLLLLGLVAGECANNGGAVGEPRLQVLRDVESYAIASCLVSQAQPYLKDQGDAWASAVVQRMKGDLDALAGITEQVKLENAKGEMAVVRDETGPGRDKTLPVLYCSEIIDRPAVRAAIQTAVATLQRFYRR